MDNTGGRVLTQLTMKARAEIGMENLTDLAMASLVLCVEDKR